jgi:hypothetical protein
MFSWISKYGLEDDTVDFIGHALALHRDDSYLDEPALDTVKQMKVIGLCFPPILCDPLRSPLNARLHKRRSS